ncbi:MAG: UDP-glucose 4-epimerase GalE [Ancrocorticia sp.]|jgi:UDP-glucose 4-epimerase|nr:UDP-glucose 4-epimerase GalE [Ancrocorticia sp.]MCI1896417.1 UDP-glucose 4-epimerase GalE [Ancrocorticia sp.]MCI1932487.1 UDP-glucose 4-epimerase GalE [Ancrocorticia sp.]MCI1962612.1 UDP-glucose 4-epimerase GalE [Ancrocorticia sp.]MCI2002459.1 UDP-glucose 4-epimerase GalE [Ancrocorticia sp.]
MAWLVTGGAGYIGAHVVRSLSKAGMDAVVIDDLSSGHREFVPEGVPFIEGSLLDPTALAAAFNAAPIDGVIHIAGFKYAGVSVQRPYHTYTQNVTAMVDLLRMAHDRGVDKFVFSSSASVYGNVGDGLVTEDTPKAPTSPYGETKLIGEWLLADGARAHGLHYTALRYFNVVGSGSDDLYDSSPHNLFPLIFKALEEGRTPVIFGDDYPTPDGTNVRDYIHVADLADSHVAAAQKLLSGEPLATAYNLGSGDGASVRQIMDAAARVTGTGFVPRVGPRRPGDPARIVASGELAARDLGWKMTYTIDEMIATAWAAAQKHPLA